MIKECRISPETADLAKRKGFDWETNRAYYESDGAPASIYGIDNWNKAADTVSAPTQEMLQKWLREEHNLHIQVEVDFQSYSSYIIDISDNEVIHGLNDYLIYEDALEDALREALNFIK